MGIARAGRAFIQMAAIVICFYAARGVRSVDMKGVQVSADRLDRFEVLFSTLLASSP